ETQDFLKRMRTETERIHLVLRDLLDFARPEARSEEDETVADVVEVAKDAIALARPQKAFKAVAVELDTKDLALQARIAPRRLSQVMLNLLLNAGDALSEVSDARV